MKASAGLTKLQYEKLPRVSAHLPVNECLSKDCEIYAKELRALESVSTGLPECEI
jgi:hypothetical protein